MIEKNEIYENIINHLTEKEKEELLVVLEKHFNKNNMNIIKG